MAFGAGYGDMWLIELPTWPVAEANAYLAGFDGREREPDPGLLYGIHFGEAKPKQYWGSDTWQYYLRCDTCQANGGPGKSTIIVDLTTDDAVGFVRPGASGSGVFHAGSGLLVGMPGVASDEAPSIFGFGSVWTNGLGAYLVPNPGDESAKILQGQDAPLPPPAPTIALNVTQPIITLGESSTLDWTSTDADRCVASGAWAGEQPTSGSFVFTPVAEGDYSFSLTCENASDVVAIDTRTVRVKESGGGGALAGGGGALDWALLVILAGAAHRRRT